MQTQVTRALRQVFEKFFNETHLEFQDLEYKGRGNYEAFFLVPTPTNLYYYFVKFLIFSSDKLGGLPGWLPKGVYIALDTSTQVENYLGRSVLESRSAGLTFTLRDPYSTTTCIEPEEGQGDN